MASIFHKLTSKAEELYGMEEKRIKNNKKELKLYPKGSDATANIRVLLEEAEKSQVVLDELKKKIRLIRLLLRDKIPNGTGFKRTLETIYHPMEQSRYEQRSSGRIDKLIFAKQVCDNLISTIKRQQTQQQGFQARV